MRRTWLLRVLRDRVCAAVDGETVFNDRLTNNKTTKTADLDGLVITHVYIYLYLHMEEDEEST